MPKLTRDDGVSIHWEESGEGPAVILAPYRSGHPSAFDPIAAELGRDHRVIRYDAWGTGQSTRSGPHDMATAAGDLAAVAESVGGDAVAVTLADACPAPCASPRLARIWWRAWWRPARRRCCSRWRGARRPCSRPRR